VKRSWHQKEKKLVERGERGETVLKGEKEIIWFLW
jgi:hypothetical protein